MAKASGCSAHAGRAEAGAVWCDTRVMERVDRVMDFLPSPRANHSRAAMIHIHSKQLLIVKTASTFKAASAFKTVVTFKNSFYIQNSFCAWKLMRGLKS
jgi:hypothetical protein